MRLDNRFLIKDSISVTPCLHFAPLHLILVFYKSTKVSPLGFIEFIISYKSCIMKYTFRYSVAHGVQNYKMYFK